MLSEDSFYFSEAPTQKTGLDLMLEAITTGLEPHLRGEPFTRNVSAALAIESGKLQVTMTALTPLGVGALRRFTGDSEA